MALLSAAMACRNSNVIGCSDDRRNFCDVYVDRIATNALGRCYSIIKGSKEAYSCFIKVKHMSCLDEG